MFIVYYRGVHYQRIVVVVVVCAMTCRHAWGRWISSTRLL